tara:strand:- start:1053 stop:1274 length:222 start_codon:yes stop_codon:yes gene_type:complete
MINIKVGDLVNRKDRDYKRTRRPQTQRYYAVGVVTEKNGGDPWPREYAKVYWNDTNKSEWLDTTQIEVIKNAH